MKRTFKKNSRETQSQKILGRISANDAEKLLRDWANLPTWGHPPTAADADMRNASVRRMLSRHREIFSSLEKSKEFERLLSEIRDWLQRAWDAPDVRHRDWYLFTARYRYESLHGDDAMIPDVPHVTPFEAAIFYVQTNAHRMQRCPNPSCPAPYFLKAPGKKVQKFCSPECAGPSRQESKRRWWASNRAKLRRG
jgi:hypothetical protein